MKINYVCQYTYFSNASVMCLHGNVHIFIQISLKFIPEGIINANIGSVNVLALRKRHDITWTHVLALGRYTALWTRKVL